MGNKVTIADWAQMVGVSRQSAYRAMTRCEIPVEAGLVDPDVATMLYRKHTRVRANPRAPSAVQAPAAASAPEVDQAGGYWLSRSRREEAEARLAELKLAEQCGELVRAADVRAAYSKRAAGLREALLQIPARLAAVLAAESDHVKCHDLLQLELHQVLRSLTEG